MTAPRMLDLIAKKRDGGKHSPDELHFIVEGAAGGGIPDYQLSAWLMAVVFKGMDAAETAAFTQAMAVSGEPLKLSSVQPCVDKHSTGGVGDGVSIALAPLVASAGVTVPMMSGRGLGHTGGTLDKLESIPGFKVALKPAAVVKQLQAAKVCMFGQTETLAPADRKLYALRDATGTVGSVPLIVASILSKKLSEDLKALVLDVKAGSGAIFQTQEEAEVLASALVATAGKLKLKCTALLTDMEEPLGVAVGNAVEVAEAVQILHGDKRAKDYIEVMLALGGWMLHLAGKAKGPDEGIRILENKLTHGEALARFKEMVKLQGGDPAVADNPYGVLPRAKHVATLRAKADGYVVKLNARGVGQAASLLGAGRQKAEDSVDLSAGILLHKKVADTVHKGEVLATFHSSHEDKLKLATAAYEKAVEIGPQKPAKRSTILKIIK